MQKRSIQFKFVYFEEARKTITIGNTATNDWRPLHFEMFLLLRIPIDHIHRSHIYTAQFFRGE